MSDASDSAELTERLRGYLVPPQIDPIDPAAQALSILSTLETWCTPGRGFKVTRAADGRFQATLLEVERRTSEGETMAAALAQIAMAASFEPIPESD